MSRIFDPAIKKLAKERGHSYLFVRLDMSTLKPQPGSTVTFQKTLSPGREEELVALFKRWWAEDQGQPAAPDTLTAAAPELLEMADAHERQHQHRKACAECNGPNRPCEEGKALITRVYALRVLALAKVRGEELGAEFDLPATANDKG